LTTTEPRDLEPIRRRDDLVAPFAEACKPPAAWRIGPEVEKPGVFEATYAPVPYEGERSILRIFELLASEHGWRVEREQDDGPPVALLRGDASVTLEPSQTFSNHLKSNLRLRRSFYHRDPLSGAFTWR